MKRILCDSFRCRGENYCDIYEALEDCSECPDRGCNECVKKTECMNMIRALTKNAPGQKKAKSPYMSAAI